MLQLVHYTKGTDRQGDTYNSVRVEILVTPLREITANEEIIRM